MNNPEVLPLAGTGDVIRYVVIDDEPRYRTGLAAAPGQPGLELVGGYPDVESFQAIHHQPCHVIVLDLCLNRRTGDAAVLQGVTAVRTLADQGHRVLVHTADDRPEPVARCVAAGAAGYVSKYNGGAETLAQAITEIARQGRVTNPVLTAAIRDLVGRCRDVRLSDTVEATLALLDHGLSDKQIAEQRHIAVRTVEDHKQKILQEFGAQMEANGQGFADLAHDLGIGKGDLVTDAAGSRPARGALRRALAWAWQRPTHPAP
jgi:two-component system, NarL family, nitrate/nitrite response regulator NarL